MILPNVSIENSELSTSFGRKVIKWEVIHVNDGQRVSLRFVSKNSSWRQGVWLRCDGGLAIAGGVYSNVDLWEDSAPATVEIDFPTKECSLHFYNIWDRGRGRESQSFTSGMLMEEEGVVRRYRCNDIGYDPEFTKLVFEIARRMG